MTRQRADLYRTTRDRIVQLVSDLDDASWRIPVAACPRWTVRDVAAHLAAVAEEVVCGRLTGPPTDEQAAAQIARFDGRTVDDIMAAWSAAAAELDRTAESGGAASLVIDVVSHEHDLRGALGRPGARDSDAVRYTSDRLLTGLRTPVSLRVSVGDAEYSAGRGGEPEIELRTTRFDALRWRMGRRSRAQLAAMDWTGDPGPVLDHLCVFGPAAVDVVE